jgi:hypothetical protein
MMGGVSPETCWASYKYEIIKILIHCCILLDFSLWINRDVFRRRLCVWCSAYKCCLLRFGPSLREAHKKLCVGGNEGQV